MKNSNNRAEAYTLLMGTMILKKRKIQNPIIMGDSAIIIEAMLSLRTPPNGAMGRIVNTIRKNTIDLGSVTFKHILWENNNNADHQANQEVARL